MSALVSLHETGFAAAHRLGYTHALQVDADGQQHRDERMLEDSLRIGGMHTRGAVFERGALLQPGARS